LFPEVRLAIGPPIEDGFYYDFDLGKDERGKPRTFAPEDLERIEARMQELLRENAEFQHTTMPVDEALAFFGAQPYKVELIVTWPRARWTRWATRRPNRRPRSASIASATSLTCAAAPTSAARATSRPTP
jgi:threonyl-tRNA synthetase